MVINVDSGLQIIEVTDPSNPVVAGNLKTKSARGVSTMYIDETIYAMVADDKEGLIIININNP